MTINFHLPEEDRQKVTPPSTITAGSGAPGMQGLLSTGKANDPNNYVNRPPDYRLNDIVSRHASDLVSGIIQRVDKGNKPFPYACRFLFNPSVVTTQYSVAEGVTPGGELTVDQAKGIAVYPGQTGVGFSLLFDRTFEVAYDNDIYSKVGCYADIFALEQVTGITQDIQAGTTDDNGVFTQLNSGKDGKSNPSLTPNAPNTVQGNMLMIPVYLIFGGGKGVKNAAGPVPGLTYVGYITSMTVNWGLFSENMVPIRCSVDLSFQQLIGKQAADFTKDGSVLNRARSSITPTAKNKTTTGSGRT